MKPHELAQKLSSLAELAEDIFAGVYNENPEVARKFKKIADYSRKKAIGVRAHGSMPLDRFSYSPIMQTAKTMDKIVRNMQEIAQVMPKGRDT